MGRGRRTSVWVGDDLGVEEGLQCGEGDDLGVTEVFFYKREDLNVTEDLHLSGYRRASWYDGRSSE